ncbi:MAG: GIY-YIG nuclease family protein [Ignavibacteriaceae bacterium]|nr:GIY-YIG nuclease family protein [Ignavibacteriaceae bacterium]
MDYSQFIDDTSFCILDVETTGMKPPHDRIIEIALIIIKNGKAVNKFETLLNPGVLIPPFITDMTGITNEAVYNAPVFSEAADKILELIENTIIVGHNIAFDLRFLNSELQIAGFEKVKTPSVCTLKLAHRIHPELHKKSLGSLAAHLRIKQKSAHRAFDDTLVTAKVFLKFVQKIKEEYNLEYLRDLLNFQYTPVKKIVKKEIASASKNVLSFIPDLPGVYEFVNKSGKVIYIGKAKSLRERLADYYREYAPGKSKLIVHKASKIRLNATNTELTALFLESEMIKEFDPRFNIMLKNYGNKYFLKVGRNHPYPDITLSNKFETDGNDYFGLFISRKKASEVLEVVNKSFMLRECTDKEFKKGKPCLLYDIERCTGPCFNNEFGVYDEELVKLYNFLKGANSDALSRLIGKMKKFSGQLLFEQASETKNLIEMIMKQVHKSSLLSEPVNKARALFEISGFPDNDYVILFNGKVYIRGFRETSNTEFLTILDDIFDETFSPGLPDEQDFERLRTLLNWCVSNREKVTIHYFSSYPSKEKLIMKLRLSERIVSASEINLE